MSSMWSAMLLDTFKVLHNGAFWFYKIITEEPDLKSTVIGLSAWCENKSPLTHNYLMCGAWSLSYDEMMSAASKSKARLPSDPRFIFFQEIIIFPKRSDSLKPIHPDDQKLKNLPPKNKICRNIYPWSVWPAGVERLNPNIIHYLALT